MNYTQAIERLFALESRGIRMGVSRMAAGLSHRGHPERGQTFVHVAGTNGKGSVAAMIASVLSSAGYRVGLYTSPHMHRYVERVRIAGRPISEREAARRIGELLADFERPGAPETTFFELTTLLAIEAFRDHRCDVAVLEVGLGGRLDATNAVSSALSVITRIALDHTAILGDSMGEIAGEKAGILKRGVPAVFGVRDPEARRVIARRARRLSTEPWWIDRDFAVEGADVARRRLDVRVGNHLYEQLRVGLAGSHQLDNAACAVAGVERLRADGFRIDDAALRRGLARTRWPGRLECLPGEPTFVFDAAHNPDGCAALAEFLREADPWLRRRRRSQGGKRVLLFGAMRDKDRPAMMRELSPLFDRIYHHAPEMRRASPAKELASLFGGTATRGLADALARARRSAGPGGEVVVAGSIFLIAEVRAAVLGLASDPLIRM